MAPHSSTLAWKLPWTEEPGRLQSMGLLRVRHDWVTSLSLSCIGEGNGNPLQYSCLEKSHGWRSLVGYSSWDRKESDMTEQLHFDRKQQNSVKQLSFNKNTTERLSLHFTSIKNKLILKRDILTTNLTLFLTLFCSWGRKVNVQKRRNWNCSFL